MAAAAGYGGGHHDRWISRHRPHFAATAATSTLLAGLIVARDWLARHTRSREAAERYVVLLESGYLRALAKAGGGLDDAVSHLATAGGLNAQLLAHMEEAGTMQALEGGLDGLLKR